MSHWGTSYLYPQHMFLWWIKKNINRMVEKKKQIFYSHLFPWICIMPSSLQFHLYIIRRKIDWQHCTTSSMNQLIRTRVTYCHQRPGAPEVNRLYVYPPTATVQELLLSQDHPRLELPFSLSYSLSDYRGGHSWLWRAADDSYVFLFLNWPAILYTVLTAF